MVRGPDRGWPSLGDLPIDAGQRDAMLMARVRSHEGGRRWRVPEEWPGAWIVPRSPASPHTSGDGSDELDDPEAEKSGAEQSDAGHDDAGHDDAEQSDAGHDGDGHDTAREHAAAGADTADADLAEAAARAGTEVWLDGVGDWLAGGPGWAQPASTRRPPRGPGVRVGVGVAGQDSLWRHRRALAHADIDDGPDQLAERWGPRLADLEGVHSAAAGLEWATATLPGWVKGGPLHLPCPHHGAPLAHWRCDHAGSVGRKRRFLAGCSQCDARDVSALGKRLAPLLLARAALDAEVSDAPGSSTHRVYVVDVVTPDGGRGRYVGQTSGDVGERIEQHRSGGDRAARVFRAGAEVGDLRTDLVPDEWALSSTAAALAAEAFVHRWLEAREPGARVWGDVALLR